MRSKTTTPEQDQERLTEVMATILSGQANPSKIDKNVNRADLAYVIDILKVARVKMDTLKQELGKKIPIATLLYVMSDLLIDPAPTVLTQFVQEWSKTSDDLVRKKLVEHLKYAENVLWAANHAEINTDRFAAQMWDLFIQHVNNKDNAVKVPFNVSTKIQAALIKQRCAAAPSTAFLSKETGHFNSLFPSSEPMNSPELCPIVKNLHILSQKTLVKKMQKCETAFAKYEKAYGNDSVSYKDLQTQLVRYQQSANNWADVEMYKCMGEGPCIARHEKLAALAAQVHQYADTCLSSIQNIRKQDQKRRAPEKSRLRKLFS